MADSEGSYTKRESQTIVIFVYNILKFIDVYMQLKYRLNAILFRCKYTS